MRDTEVTDAILKIQHRVEARANGLADELAATLHNVLHSLLAIMSEQQDRYLTGAAWDEETYTRKRAYMQAQRNAVETMLASVYADMQEPIADAVRDTMLFAEKQIGVSMGAALAGTGFPPAVAIPLAPGALGVNMALVSDWISTQTAEGLLINEWLQSMSRASADRIVSTGREALVRGLGSRETARLMRLKGIEGNVPQLETLSRTFLLSASNHAFEQSIERMTAGTSILKGWKYIASLDGRTCPVCGADDGRTFTTDAPRPKLPRHRNCRCTYVPVVRMDGKTVNRTALKHEGRTVHHRDGSLSTRFTIVDVEKTTESYAQWLKRQCVEDPAFVRSVLGKTRFELFQKGKITLDKMRVDGRVKRLVEL